MHNLENPIVSVVMPIFGHSEFQLITAIKSILNQTFENLELIIVDGRLDNKNFDIISSIKDDRIRYFKIKGYINCLNLGISNAKGKYVARMDSDDISLPTRIEEQVRFLDENPEISLCSCLVENFNKYGPLWISKHTAEINLINLINNCEFVHTAMMFRKEINLHYDNLKPVEDCLLFRKLLLAGYKFGIIDKVLLKGYVSNESIMTRHPKLMTYYMSKINLFALFKYYNLNLSFLDEIFSKKCFSSEEVKEFLKVASSLKQKLRQTDLDFARISIPYINYIFSKIPNKTFILMTKEFYEIVFKYYSNLILRKTLRTIFSITNKYYVEENIRYKQKVLCVLGLKINLRCYKNCWL